MIGCGRVAYCPSFGVTFPSIGKETCVMGAPSGHARLRKSFQRLRGKTDTMSGMVRHKELKSRPLARILKRGYIGN